jgi:hypothetical protein
LARAAAGAAADAGIGEQFGHHAATLKAVPSVIAKAGKRCAETGAADRGHPLPAPAPKAFAMSSSPGPGSPRPRPRRQ